MEVRALSPEAYATLVRQPFSVFDSVSFSQINAAKVDAVYYLVFSDDKNRFGLIAGIKDGVLKAPFSAPYACFSEMSQNIKIGSYSDVVPCLTAFASAQQCKKVRVTLPPAGYSTGHMARLYNSFYVAGYKIAGCDLNFQYDLSRFDDQYEMRIDPKARQKLRAAIKNGLSFERTDDVAQAYAIIKANREHKNYPLWMSLENVLETIKIVPAEFFLVRDSLGKAVASAMIYGVTEETVLVVYWGNLPETDGLKPMNFMAYKAFDYYAKKGKRLFDIGPSTEFSIPNVGLCDFKQSLGCGVSTKLTFEKGL